MKTTTVVATAGEDYIHIILLSWLPVLNTHLGAPYYICALDIQDVYFPSLLQVVFAQDLAAFNPNPDRTAPLIRHLTSTSNRENGTKTTLRLTAEKIDCFPPFRLTSYIIL